MDFQDHLNCMSAAHRTLANEYQREGVNPIVAVQNRRADSQLLAKGYLDLLHTVPPARVELWAHGTFMDPSWGIGASFITLHW
jgi:hypothetical protein